jgi:hypothetical protein
MLCVVWWGEQHQVPKARLRDPGWLVDFHQEAAMPLPTEEMANTGLVPNASVDMQLDSETETEGGAAERGRDTKRTRDVFESDGVVVCNNRLTSGGRGDTHTDTERRRPRACICLLTPSFAPLSFVCVDLASLVMVHYLWSGPRVVKTPHALNLLAPLPVVWELPQALLMGLLGDASLAGRVYKSLLRPSGDSEVFFLQDLLTLFNGCGWAGRLKQVTPTPPSSTSQDCRLSPCGVCGNTGCGHLHQDAMDTAAVSHAAGFSAHPTCRTRPVLHPSHRPARLRHVSTHQPSTVLAWREAD